jgi:hypothetical protein
MNNQFLFIINDIRKSKVCFTWNIIQISIVCVLLFIVLQSIFEYRDVKSKFDKITEQSEIYMFRLLSLAAVIRKNTNCMMSSMIQMIWHMK